MRVFLTQDPFMPPQIVDKGGRRVDSLSVKKHLFALVPEFMHERLEGMGLVIQIPLPLTQNRDAFQFEGEDAWLQQIQTYVAIEMYKSYASLIINDPKFAADVFPAGHDFDSNQDPRYWLALDPESNPDLFLNPLDNHTHLFNVAKSVNEGSAKGYGVDWQNLLTMQKWFSGVDGEAKKKALIPFIAHLKVKVGNDFTTLIERRVAAWLQSNDEESAREARRWADYLGVDLGHAMSVSFPGLSERGSAVARHAESSRKKIRELPESEWNEQQQRLMALAQTFGSILQAKFTLLDGDGLSEYIGNREIRLFASLARSLGESNSSRHVHLVSDTLIHEISHVWESRDLEAGLVSGNTVYYTHDQRGGHFSEAMKRLAAILLAKIVKENVKLVAVLESRHSVDLGPGGMDAAASVAKAPGGIDLNPVNDALQIKSHGDAIKFNIDPAMLEALKASPGFAPMIISVTPLKDVRVFLGI